MNETVHIDTDNVMSAWRAEMDHLLAPGVDELGPVVVRIRNSDWGAGLDGGEAKRHLDRHLKINGRPDCGEVASTIFPRSLWNPSVRDEGRTLFDLYDQIWPRIKERSQMNRRGVYFRRLTSFSPDTEGGEHPVNQLLHIIRTFKSGNHRRSALVGMVFDPTRDHTNARQLGFPCLQHVSFEPDAPDGLTVTGYYTKQYVLDRAYGNLLGLAHLGQFMAHELGRELGEVRCIANIASLGHGSKTDARRLLQDCFS